MTLFHANQEAEGGPTHIRCTSLGLNFTLEVGQELWLSLTSPTQPTRTTSVRMWPPGQDLSTTLVGLVAGLRAGGKE